MTPQNKRWWLLVLFLGAISVVSAVMDLRAEEAPTVNDVEWTTAENIEEMNGRYLWTLPRNERMRVRVWFTTPTFSVVTGLYNYDETEVRVVEIALGTEEYVAQGGFWLKDDVVDGHSRPDGYVAPGAIIRVERAE